MTMKVRKAVFPAAGLGTRFLPATKAQPKEMLPIVDKPIIQYGVEEALAAGCDQIIIVTGRGKQAIEDHFDVSYELEKMLEEREGPAISSYGVLGVGPADGRFNGRLFEIKNMVEKPTQAEAPSNLAIIGRYILTPTVFETLSETPLGAGGELQLTDGMRLLLKKEKIYAYVYEGRRHDTGDKLGFLKATVEFALKREGLGDEFRRYLKELAF